MVKILKRMKWYYEFSDDMAYQAYPFYPDIGIKAKAKEMS